MVILASQFELAVGNPLNKVHHVPCDQSGGILDNLRTNADMTLRNCINSLFIKSANILVRQLPVPRVELMRIVKRR